MYVVVSVESTITGVGCTAEMSNDWYLICYLTHQSSQALLENSFFAVDQKVNFCGENSCICETTF